MPLAAYERLSLQGPKNQAVAGRALIPFAAAALLFTLINLILLNQPMTMRHGI